LKKNQFSEQTITHTEGIELQDVRPLKCVVAPGKGIFWAVKGGRAVGGIQHFMVPSCNSILSSKYLIRSMTMTVT
jgi:hypothetical protein